MNFTLQLFWYVKGNWSNPCFDKLITQYRAYKRLFCVHNISNSWLSGWIVCLTVFITFKVVIWWLAYPLFKSNLQFVFSSWPKLHPKWYFNGDSSFLPTILCARHQHFAKWLYFVIPYKLKSSSKPWQIHKANKIPNKSKPNKLNLCWKSQHMGIYQGLGKAGFVVTREDLIAGLKGA